MSMVKYYDKEEHVGFWFHPSAQELIIRYIGPKFVKVNHLSENVTGKRISRKVKGETVDGCWKGHGKLSDVVLEDTGAVIGKKSKFLRQR
ncbi:unnamed protein product [Arabidopsis thaliana]|uniref:NAC domain-containing protein n=1 Tax=Arabidopsis thaliana TaxID=3702 RepID=A0A5S9Y5P8_ARATH|nr:unnamed protein product [Arabidopsis thaliana]